MTKLVIMHNQQAVTSSLQVAESFGKRHGDVIRAIEAKLNSTQNCAQYSDMFAAGEYVDGSGKSNKMYYMNRDGFTFIAFGFTGAKADQFKLDYINAFNQLEQQTRKALPQTPEERLMLTMDVANRTVKRVKKIEADVKDLKDNQLASAGQYAYVGKHANLAVSEYVALHGLQLTQKQRGALYHDINHGLNTYLGIRTRTQLKAKDFDKACDFISNWTPSTAVAMQVRTESVDMEV
ncbi:Rha family transcriptional regulator [Lacticaseibacillus hulanensis]|uniref:Rha family transcriptional regulator n=1 Tax=Lacticaseibacillus hulanensis TaxID=2493111 RepID=UPI000FDAA21C|nr:Rha family transcriptional regulator [Lacticaseibacillus hulanensis]